MWSNLPLLATRRQLRLALAWLSRHDARSLWAATQLALLGCLFEIGLRVLPLPRLVSGVRRLAGSRPGDLYPIGVRRLGQPRLLHIAAGVASRLRGRRGCLPRCLLWLWLLSRDATPPVLVLGVRRDARTPFLAHAWLEANQAPLGEPAAHLAHFRVIARY